jgi:hypothetical protein
VLDCGRRARSDRTTHAGRRQLAATKVEALTGTVHELIVDDTTRGTSQRYIELELADCRSSRAARGRGATAAARRDG